MQEFKIWKVSNYRMLEADKSNYILAVQAPLSTTTEVYREVGSISIEEFAKSVNMERLEKVRNVLKQFVEAKNKNIVFKTAHYLRNKYMLTMENIYSLLTKGVFLCKEREICELNCDFLMAFISIDLEVEILSTSEEYFLLD